MTSDWDLGTQRQSARTVRTSIVVLILLLAAIVVIQLLPRPSAVPPAQPPKSPYVFARQPDVRVRIFAIEPGQSVDITGVDKTRDNGTGKITVANQAGVARLGGTVVNLPFVIESTGKPFAIGTRRYNGDLLLAAEADSQRIVVVNRLPMEQYLEGVVLSEMPSDYRDEALRAQAVASRSYAAWQVMTRRSRPYDVSDTERSQVYQGTPARTALAHRVVSETRGRGLLHMGRVIEAVFSSTCGGHTRGAEEAFGDQSVPPLAGTTCGLCDGTQFSSWKGRARRSDVGKSLGLGGAVSGLTDPEYYDSDRLAGITIKGPKAEKRLTGNQFRELFGQSGKSTWFTSIQLKGDAILIEGRGYGHGVGMCQVGAQKMAQAGQDHAAILAKYYPGAIIALLYPLDQS